MTLRLQTSIQLRKSGLSIERIVDRQRDFKSVLREREWRERPWYVEEIKGGGG